MAREIPEVVRTAAGLAATVVDEARKLPETLPGLPVRVIGRAMQHAMKVQQTYAGFVARGDELFTGFRGEDEPGMATFDDDVEPEQPASTGFRESAFDRADDIEPTSSVTDLIVDEEIALEELVEDRAADAVVDAAIEDVVSAPDAEEILDEIAIDELVDQAPTLEETAPVAATPAKAAKAAKPRKAATPRKAAQTPTPTPAPAPVAVEVEKPADTVDAEPSADVATPIEVLTPAAEAPATAEAPAAAVTPATSATPAPSATSATSATSPTPATDEPASKGTDSPSTGSAPVDGYDSLTIAQLRGRMRGYVLSTVSDLLSYEQATRAREPYVRMLRNRLEKLEEQAVDASPLAPRGA
jgi:hypothetical protein